MVSTKHLKSGTFKLVIAPASRVSERGDLGVQLLLFVVGIMTLWSDALRGCDSLQWEKMEDKGDENDPRTFVARLQGGWSIGRKTLCSSLGPRSAAVWCPFGDCCIWYNNIAMMLA